MTILDVFVEYKESILPFLIFFLGVASGSIEKLLQAKNSKNKLKKIFSYEIERNLQLITVYREKIKESKIEKELEKINSFAHTSMSFSTTIFESYISKIEILDKELIDGLLGYYTLIKRVIDTNAEIVTLTSNSDYTTDIEKKIISKGSATKIYIDKITERTPRLLKILS